MLVLFIDFLISDDLLALCYQGERSVGTLIILIEELIAFQWTYDLIFARKAHRERPHMFTYNTSISIIAHNALGITLVFTYSGVSRAANVAHMFDIVRSLVIISLLPHNWLVVLIINLLCFAFVRRLKRRGHWEGEMLQSFSSLLEYYLLIRVYIAVF